MILTGGRASCAPRVVLRSEGRLPVGQAS